MTISKARAKRIGQRMQQEMAVLLQRRISDPRLALVTVTGIDVDRELAYATVFVTSPDAAERKDEILRALTGARGYLRSELASSIELRVFPRLRFRLDDTPDRGARIDELLSKLESNGEDEL